LNGKKQEKNDTKINYFKQLINFTFYETINVENPENCQESPENPPLSPFFKGGTLISSLY
jgi:hypothetical protein